MIQVSSMLDNSGYFVPVHHQVIYDGQWNLQVLINGHRSIAVANYQLKHQATIWISICWWKPRNLVAGYHLKPNGKTNNNDSSPDINDQS